MAMFPSNTSQPTKPSLVERYHPEQLKQLLFGFYFLIVFCWSTIQFITLFFPAVVYDSPVIANYLIQGELVTNRQLEVNPVVRMVDLYIKILLIIINSFIGTLFLVIVVLPKISKNNAVILGILMIIGYSLPIIGNVWSIFFNGEWNNLVTVNKILISTIQIPLTWCLILFGYYLYQQYFSQKQV